MLKLLSALVAAAGIAGALTLSAWRDKRPARRQPARKVRAGLA